MVRTDELNAWIVTQFSIATSSFQFCNSSPIVFSSLLRANSFVS